MRNAISSFTRGHILFARVVGIFRRGRLSRYAWERTQSSIRGEPIAKSAKISATESVGDTREDARLRLLLGLLVGKWRRVATALAAAAIQSLAAVMMVPLVRVAFDRAIPDRNIGLLAAAGGGVAGLRLIQGLMILLGKSRSIDVKTAIARELRGELLRKLYQRPYLSHVRAENQPLAIHILLDTDRVAAMADCVLSGLAPAALMCVALGFALLALNPLLVGVALLFAPLVWFASRVASFRIRANFRRYHGAHDDVARSIRLVLETFALTRARGAEAEELERQAKPLDTLRLAEMSLAIDNGRSAQLQSLAVMLVGLIVLVVGGTAVTRNMMTLGALLAFFAAAALVSGQVARLIATLPPLVEGIAALDRLDGEIRGAPSMAYHGKRLIDWRGEIALENVSFAYGDIPVLTEVSLRLAPGDSVGLVGPNGAGKSTVLNLALGFYRPSTGRLTADGVPYDELDLTALRRRIGLVPQHPVFFSGTALENIVYGAPGVGEAEVEAAVERIGAERVLRDLPGGLTAPLGENGLMLSGGQRQMIAILRALVVRPRLLILDEPTNHLDQPAISGLVRAMRSGTDGPALLLISHRPEIAEEVDVVYALNAGRLAAFNPVAA